MQVRSSYFLLGILFTLGCAAKGGRPRTVENCGIVDVSPQGGIINGSWDQPSEYPWMVSIQEYYHGFNHFCSGAILNEHWIVTAARCLFEPDKPWRYEVYVAVHRLMEKDSKPSEKYKVSKIIVYKDHESRNSTLSANDIALLRTTEPINIRNSGGYANSVCLPLGDEEPTGWAIWTRYGHSLEEEDYSDVLKALKVPIVPRDVCSEFFDEDPDYAPENNISDRVLCAGEDNMDSCGLVTADAGSPLVQRNEKGVYTLIGIVSYYTGCRSRNHPVVYTKVASYLDWLYENMKDT